MTEVIVEDFSEDLNENVNHDPSEMDTLDVPDTDKLNLDSSDDDEAG